MTAAIICGLFYVLFVAFIVSLMRGGQRYHWPPAHEQHLRAERERMFPGASPGKLTSDFDCHPKPCDREDGRYCTVHRCGEISPQTGAVCLREATHADPWHVGRLGCWQTGKRGHEVIRASITDVPAGGTR